MIGVFVEWEVPMPQKRRHGVAGWIIDGNGCHIWVGFRGKDGYGKVNWQGRSQSAHRARYEREIGPVPDGMFLDHFACDNGAGGCCNPLHVRPVSPRENLLRSDNFVSHYLARTHCDKGHLLAGENIHKPSARMGRGRVCATCCKAASREYWTKVGGPARREKRAKLPKMSASEAGKIGARVRWEREAQKKFAP